MALLSHPSFVPPGAAAPATDGIARMNQLLVGDLALQVVRAAAVHGLADHAAAGPLTPAGFAGSARLDEATTVRFFRAAVAVGLLEPDADGRFRGTELLDTLRSDRPDSMRDLAAMFGDALMVHGIEKLPNALRTGHSQAREAFGEPFFDWLGDHPERAATFTRGMAGLTAGIAELVVGALDLGDARTLVDVGGGDGGLARAFLRAHPELRAVVFDLPRVVDDAVQAARADGLAERVSTVGGDFFAWVPEGDVCVLKHIVHGWNDLWAAKVLANCRNAVGPSGRVVLVEQVVGETGGGVEALFDMLMLTLMHGRERTRAEFEALLTRAGLTLQAVLPTGSANRIIVATPTPT